MIQTAFALAGLIFLLCKLFALYAELFELRREKESWERITKSLMRAQARRNEPESESA